MAIPERERRRITDGFIRVTRVISVGLAIIGGSIAGVNALKGNYENTEKYGIRAAIYSLVAGGIFAAEREMKKNSESKPPDHS